MATIISIKGIVHPKMKTVIIDSLMSLQTCMRFFLMLNIKKNDDIMKNVGNQTVAGPH